jgi:glycosyltransferase involved in cell wall biosynthesis
MAGVLVHEWISQSGGSENVLQAMSEVYPEADIVCLWNDSIGRFAPERLRESWLARSPLRRSKAAALPFMPTTWRKRKNRGYDWALISSHLFAHHVRFNPQPGDFRRYVYVHTPARYIWAPELDGRGRSHTARTIAAALKPLDRRRAQQPAIYAANSHFVRRRISVAWGLEARVIYPPVEVTAIQQVEDWSARLDEKDSAVLAGLPQGYLLGASRFVPYKRLELVIRAGEAADRPVVLAGRGPERGRLRLAAAAASVPVHFVDCPSVALLRALYQKAALFVFPAVEDFGIMPVEAMAAGAPVLAQAVGGATETVVPGLTGALTAFSSPAAIREGVATALSTAVADCRRHAGNFRAERFREEIRAWIGAS